MLLKKFLTPMVASAGMLALALTSCNLRASEKSLDFNGFVAMQGGQFVNYKYHSRDYGGKWLQQNIMGFSIHTQIHPRLELFSGIAGGISYNTLSDTLILKPDVFFLAPVVGFGLDRAEMTLHCSPDPGDSLLDIGIGLFNEKYNREARNLGEYLFRSGAYPGYINQTGFDQNFSQLAGVRIDNHLFGMWHNKLLLTSELYLQPFNDFSLAYLTDVSLFKQAFTLGAGIQWFRFLSVDKDQTSPRTIKGREAPNYYDKVKDSIGYDSVTSSIIWDSSYGGWYTFTGTKVMARMTFDPKQLLGGAGIFGAEDLKLYSEVAILGLKNYPANPNTDNPQTFGWEINKFGFDTLAQKMPIMFGMNVPAFKLLDLLSLEFEFYGKKYVNAVPIPSTPAIGGYYPVSTPPYRDTKTEYDTTNLYETGAAQWKWSIYARKTLFNSFAITAQAARDHIRTIGVGIPPANIDREEALVKAKHWYWMVKFSSHF